MNSSTGLFTELRRRNVFRVAAAYAVVAWLLLQLADILLGNFGAPDWVFKSFVALLILGFPLALFLAWAYELTPEGVRRTEEIGVSESIRTQTGRRIDRLIIVGLVAVIALLIAERFWITDEEAVEDTIAPVAEVPAEAILQTLPAAEAQLSIAVLPFANVSPDPEQEFFADGITEDILTRLAGLGGLRVISRTSVMRYKGSDLSLPRIAEELSVSHILEGSVRRVGDRVRITGQLIHAATDDHLWAESYDRDLADVFAVQSEIASRIAEALELRLTERDRRRLVQGGTENPEAYEFYLKGLAEFNRIVTGPAEVLAMVDEAGRWFRASLVEDPEYAAAQAGLARALRVGIDLRPPEERESLYEAAVEAARRAIRLAPDLASGHVQLGHAFRIRGQGEAALEQFRLAAEIDPHDPETLDALAGIYANQGRLPEAIVLLKRAIGVEPGVADRHISLAFRYAQLGELERARLEFLKALEELTTHPARLSCHLAEVSLRAGQPEHAREHIERTVSLEPDSAFGRNCALLISLSLRDFTEAGRHLEAQKAFFEALFPLNAAHVVAHLGDHDRLGRLLEAAERNVREELPRAWGSILEYNLAQIAALRGETELALIHLERAVEKGWRSYRELELNPVWDAIRDKPGFRELKARHDDDLARKRLGSDLDIFLK